MLKEKRKKFKMSIINKEQHKYFNKNENSANISSNFQKLKKTLQGKNNIFFLINDSNHEILQHYDNTFQTKLNYDLFIKSIDSKNHFFKSLNINYNLFIIPDKSITLREYLPFNTINPNRHTNYLKGYLYDLHEIIEQDFLDFTTQDKIDTYDDCIFLVMRFPKFNTRTKKHFANHMHAIL